MNSPELASPTPMLKQYQEIKSNHKNCILFYRLGDFYEMFYDDAKVGSRVLELVLTSRGKGTGNEVPMCGIPYHAAEGYIARLVKSGYKVAICEQIEDPALAKGIVRRDVTRIITSGTHLDESDSGMRLLVALAPGPQHIGIAFIDPTAGTIQTNQYPIKNHSIVELLSRLPVYECLFPESQENFVKGLFAHSLLKSKAITLSPYEDWCFNPEIAQKTLREHFAVHNLSGFGIDDGPQAVAASGAMLEYLKAMNKQPLKHIDRVALYNDSDFVFISPAAHKGLELDTLIKTLDHTQTAMGGRKFQDWFYHPLKNIAQIEDRQAAIKLLLNIPRTQEDLRIQLNRVPDLEKNISRLSCGYTHARDILAIRNVLGRIPQIQTTLEPMANRNSLFSVDDIKNLREYLEKTINEEIPLSHPEGKVIKKGVHPELDALKDLRENGRLWLAKLQEQEIKRTGISSLKIGFNSVFGYYIEITRTHADKIPKEYIRKQTLVSAERYITPELKEYEEKILTAEDKIIKIENEIINQARQEILSHSLELHRFCDTLAAIDCLYSLSVLAQSDRYIFPKLNTKTILDIREGRHPVVEKGLVESFIPNDTLLDTEQNHLIIITGPNMAGKSTYIRQVAILTIMAQVGSAIPAASATIGLVDKIFTRIGAHDDISKGQSTFMVEMNETADILNNLTEHSLVILDEIGRGTSTYDGLSLAWAIAEHLKHTKTRTLFATHFHELTALADEHEGVKNYNVAVKEWKDEIIFLHKIVPGSTDDSYGIYVAKLAGIPKSVIDRAKKILTQLELKGDLKDNLKFGSSNESQLSLFGTQDPVMKEIKETIEAMDLNAMTPIEAINHLERIKEKLK